VFSQSELEVLAKYGHWFMALQNGWIEPNTPSQAHFIACCNGDAETATSQEKLWIKYITSVRLEKIAQDYRDFENSDEGIRLELMDALAKETNPFQQQLIESSLKADDDLQADIRKWRDQKPNEIKE
jgi:uncharacterized protein YifE (UPF0438 family)